MWLIPEPDKEITYVVPTTRQAVGDVTLTVYDSVRHEVYSGDIIVDTTKPYKVSTTIQFGSLPIGQYTYTMTDGSGIISRGMMQVGLTPAEVKQYTNKETIIVYDR